jgi:transcriptional regulator
MYIPKSFENKNLYELHSFIEKYGFATLISYTEKGLQISHIPIMLDRTKGKFGTLFWHLAGLNEHSKILNDNDKTTCIFHGPHAYISPAWYKTSPNVPTWNYAVVHAQGIPKKISKENLSSDLDKLVSYHESQLNSDKKYIIQVEYKHKLLEHIDGFHMEITQIEGKFKLGQNRHSDDQKYMLSELFKQQNNYDALSLADFIKSLNRAE